MGYSYSRTLQAVGHEINYHALPMFEQVNSQLSEATGKSLFREYGSILSKWLPEIGTAITNPSDLNNCKSCLLTRAFLVDSLVLGLTHSIPLLGSYSLYNDSWHTAADQFGSLLVENASVEFIKQFQHNLELPDYNWLLCNAEERELAFQVESLPYDICLPISDKCNARCNFCTSWIEGTSFLDPSIIDVFKDVLRSARNFGYAGHGEPLIHPQFEAIVQRIEQYMHPNSEAYIITNGIHLSRYIQLICASRINTINVSLNAGSPETHEKVMGLGDNGFHQVIDNMNQLRAADPSVCLNISIVLTADNYHEIPDVIKIAEDVGAQKVLIKTLIPVSSPVIGLNYHLLPPANLDNFEKITMTNLNFIKQYSGVVCIEYDEESWRQPVLSNEILSAARKGALTVVSREMARGSKELKSQFKELPRFHDNGKGAKIDEAMTEVQDFVDIYKRRAPYGCTVAYSNLYINDFSFNIFPCCYMTTVPGFEAMVVTQDTEFKELWNAPALLELRRSLKKGPLLSPCRTCPTYY